MIFNPIDKIKNRVEIGKSDSDTAFFNNLLYYGEMLVKLTTVGMLSAVQDEREGYRYRALYQLVRATGIGDWVQVLKGIVQGPTSSYVLDAAIEEKRQLGELRKGSWQVEAAERLYDTLRVVLPDLPSKWDGTNWFELFARLRNKTRGHGATTEEQILRMLGNLETSISLYADELLLFRREWAYLQRNLSGKYRVIPLGDHSNSFQFLKSTKEMNIPNGIYINFDGPRLVELMRTDIDLQDYFFANGNFTEKKYEMISFITNAKEYGDSDPYKKPITPLPASETDGQSDLDVRGNSFTNLPPTPVGYVTRQLLEDDIRSVLMNDRHPVVTLLGRGGIGKTSTALKVIDEIMKEVRYQTVIWFSSRDIDLKEEGAKQVRPQVTTISEIAKEYWSLINKQILDEKSSVQLERFLAELTHSELGPTLFIFDNFETVTNPVELFRTLDTYIRNPNKILVTTRHREFKGDYPIEVKGMIEPEFRVLADATIRRLVMDELSESEMKDLFRKSEGHPYVVKIALGEMSKPGGYKVLDQIIANREDILDALFERTYSLLSMGAKRVFLTMCNWRSVLPQLAVEAAMLRIRSDEEKFDPQEAIEELRRVSFVEVTSSDTDQELFVSVPLAAAIFGKRKLSVDQMKALIESDTEFLQYFGAAQNTDIRHGLQPRIRNLFISIEKMLHGNPAKLDDYLPTLEFIARQYTVAWLNIADLMLKFGGGQGPLRAKEKLQKYLEYAPDSEKAAVIWQRIADINEQIGDWKGQLHALVEKCLLGNGTFQEISSVANLFNTMLSRKTIVIDTDEKHVLVEKVVEMMARRIDEANATDFSRLAWLCLNINNEAKAIEYVKFGLQIDTTNEYCLGLHHRLMGTGVRM